MVPLYSLAPDSSAVKAMDVPTIPLLPLGVAYVAAALEAAGLDVHIVDLTFSIEGRYDVERVKEAVLNLEPGVVGLSAFTATIPSAYALATALKRDRKDVPLVIGGPHAAALPHRTLEECPALDAAIVGEGEEVFRDLAQHLLSQARPRLQACLPGVVVRQGTQILGDPTPVYVEDLDRLPFPARHLFDLKRYMEGSYYFDAKQFPVASIVTSRGCPYACIYCSRVSSGRRFRARSPANVLQELEALKAQGFNEVQIVDDNFTEDRDRAMEICRLIQEAKLDMSFNLLGGVRVDKVDEVLLTRLYEAGCYAIHFGVESGDDQVLRTIRKGVTARQIKEAVQLAKRIGFKVIFYVIVGLPGSTVESEEKTIRLENECGPDATRVALCTPYPGSPLWEMVKDRLDGIAWARYNESDITNPIYLFGDQTKAQLQCWMDMFGITLP